MDDAGRTLVAAIENLGVHDHLCLIYETREEQFSAVIPFIRIGLERGEKCVYIADDNTAATVMDAMRAWGIDVGSYIKAGSLAVVSKREVYLRQGYFDPDAMINFLKENIYQAKTEGYPALRATGEMTWALGGDPGADRLIEYEAKLNYFVPDNDIVAICQYNKNRFKPEIIKEVIKTHPLVIYGGTVAKNFYYVPPDEYLIPEQPSHEIERLLHDIIERERTEAELYAKEKKLEEINRLLEEEISDRKLAETRLNEAQRVAHIGSWDWDAVKDAIWWSDEYYRIYGLDPTKPTPNYSEHLKAYAVESEERLRAAVKLAMETGEPYEVDLERAGTDGHRRWITARGEVKRDESGRIVGLRGTAQDITKRKESEEKLHEISEKRSELEFIVDHSPAVVFLWRNEEGWPVEYVSDNIRQFGYTPDDLYSGRVPYARIVHPDDLQRVAAEVAAFIREGERDEFVQEYRIVTASGETRWLDDRTWIRRNRAGNITHFQGIVLDITKRKLAQEESLRLNRLYNVLSRTNEMLVRAKNRQNLFDEACKIAVDQGSFMMAWIGMVDEQTRFIKPVAMYGNIGDYLTDIRISMDDIPEGRGPTGIALREGKHFICKDVEHEPYMEPWRAAALAMGYRSSAAFPLRVGGSVKGTYTVYAPDVNWLNDDGIRLLDELAADISYALEYLEKEDLRKRAEAEIKTLNEELEQKVLERTAQLETANKELEAFAYSVSHDLRVPLRAISGFSQIIMEDYKDKLNEEGKRALNYIAANVQKMGQLIEDILAFSRMGRKEMMHSEINMMEMARGVFEEQRVINSDRIFKFHINDLPPATGDNAMIKQVLVNLISNAVKFSRLRDVAIIEVGGRVKENETIYYVKDNGAGFDMEQADKLFGVFQRFHSAAEFEGTGVGLAVVQKIISRHGGRVWAEGKVNEGATFFFSLPKRSGA